MKKNPPEIGLLDSGAAMHIAELEHSSGLAANWQAQFCETIKTYRKEADPGFEHTYRLLYPLAVLRDRTEPVRSDYAKGRRLVAAASLGVWAVSQPVGTLRLPSAVATWLSLKFNNPAIAMGAMASWNMVSSEIFRNLLAQHPNTVDSIGSKNVVRGMVNFCEDSLLGQGSSPQDQTESDGRLLHARYANRLGRHLRLGGVVMGVGLHPSITAAALSDKSKQETRKLYIEGSIASGSALAVGAAAVAGSVAVLGESWPQAAEAIENASQNAYGLIGAAAVFIIAPQAKNIHAKLKNSIANNRLREHFRCKSEDKHLIENYARIYESVLGCSS